MGLLGLRKFIDSCGCTRLLPVPVSDAEAEAETLRRLRVEGYREVLDSETAGASSDAVYYEDSSASTARPRRLTSSSHHASNGREGHAAVGDTRSSPCPIVDHVLVDMNCIVHSCFHQQNSENKSRKQLIQEVLERLRVLLTEVVVPRQSLSICFDGPAPIAKLQTQRLRRRKVSLLDTGGAQQLNTLSITAGSLFMIELENAIASQFKLNHGRGFLRRPCPVYLYGTTVMGEGEAKISRALAFLAYGPGSPTAEDPATTTAAPLASAMRGRGYGGRGRRGGAGGSSSRHGHAAQPSLSGSPDYARYHPDDTLAVLGNDIDLVVTCLGATAYHNFSIISPSSLQLIRVSDIIYRWLKATSATRGDSPFSPAQLPSIRIDFIYLFLLNGGDHYVGAGEVAMPLWKRYRSVRATYPHSTLVSPNLDAIDIDFLADVVQASEYTGSSSVEVGMNLLQSALWSLYTVVTGVCPDYGFVPEPEAPQLCHLRAAAAHCQRTNRRIRLSDFKAQSQPLTPLETYVALMPTEATLPKSVAAGLHSKGVPPTILKTLETSNDTSLIAQAAKDAVAVSEPFLTTSEQYLRHFTPPVQLNVIPPRRRLSRHEQHRMIATQGHIQVEDPVPVVKPITMPEEVPYMEVPYPPHTTCLDFYCPFDARTNNAEEDGSEVGGPGRHPNGSAVAYIDGRAVSTRPSMHPAAAQPPTANPAGAAAATTATTPSAENDGLEHKRVYLHQEEAARAQQQQDRNSAAAKLQRALDVTSTILQRGQHFSTAQERRMRRRLQRLQAAETAELRSTMETEDRQHALGDGQDTSALEDELRRFLGADASAEDVAALLHQSADVNSSKSSVNPKSKKEKQVKKASKQASAEATSGKLKKRKATAVDQREPQRSVPTVSAKAPSRLQKRRRENDDDHTQCGEERESNAVHRREGSESRSSSAPAREKKKKQRRME